MTTESRTWTDAFAEVNGYRLRYRMGGEGPLAIFGHGLLGSLDQVVRETDPIERMRHRLRVLLYDARGHGQSFGPADPLGYTWEALGRDMAALVEQHSDGPAIVGGASMGAGTAIWVALERPELVRALLVMMPPPLGEEAVRAAEERQAVALLDTLAAMIENFGFETTLSLLADWEGLGATPEERTGRIDWLRSQNPDTVLHAIRGLIQSPFHDPEDYARIEAPVLVVAHEGDGLHPARAARLFAETVPNARLVMAPEPGYWQENPAALYAEFEAFLDDCGLRANP